MPKSPLPKLLYAPASPYSAKVRMAAAHAGYKLEPVLTETGPQGPELTGANPLGKIPVLVLDDGNSVFDSRAIMQYLNREAGGALYPRNAAKRLEAERMEALADGICDCLLAHVYERRYRPAENVQQSWLDLQWSKAERALDWLVENPPKLPSRIHGGHIALRAMLGYASLRFGGQWEKKRAKLVRWAKKFDEKFPELAEKLPK
jgi:glutathione S-transferase